MKSLLPCFVLLSLQTVAAIAFSAEPPQAGEAQKIAETAAAISSSTAIIGIAKSSNYADPQRVLAADGSEAAARDGTEAEEPNTVERSLEDRVPGIAPDRLDANLADESRIDISQPSGEPSIELPRVASEQSAPQRDALSAKPKSAFSIYIGFTGGKKATAKRLNRTPGNVFDLVIPTLEGGFFELGARVQPLSTLPVVSDESPSLGKAAKIATEVVVDFSATPNFDTQNRTTIPYTALGSATDSGATNANSFDGLPKPYIDLESALAPLQTNAKAITGTQFEMENETRHGNAFPAAERTTEPATAAFLAESDLLISRLDTSSVPAAEPTTESTTTSVETSLKETRAAMSAVEPLQLSVDSIAAPDNAAALEFDLNFETATAPCHDCPCCKEMTVTPAASNPVSQESAGPLADFSAESLVTRPEPLSVLSRTDSSFLSCAMHLRLAAEHLAAAGRPEAARTYSFEADEEELQNARQLYSVKQRELQNLEAEIRELERRVKSRDESETCTTIRSQQTLVRPRLPLGLAVRWLPAKEYVEWITRDVGRSGYMVHRVPNDIRAANSSAIQTVSGQFTDEIPGSASEAPPASEASPSPEANEPERLNAPPAPGAETAPTSQPSSTAKPAAVTPPATLPPLSADETASAPAANTPKTTTAKPATNAVSTAPAKSGEVRDDSTARIKLTWYAVNPDQLSGDAAIAFQDVLKYPGAVATTRIRKARSVGIQGVAADSNTPGEVILERPFNDVFDNATGVTPLVSDESGFIPGQRSPVIRLREANESSDAVAAKESQFPAVRLALSQDSLTVILASNLARKTSSEIKTADSAGASSAPKTIRITNSSAVNKPSTISTKIPTGSSAVYATEYRGQTYVLLLQSTVVGRGDRCEDGIPAGTHHADVVLPPAPPVSDDE